MAFVFGVVISASVNFWLMHKGMKFSMVVLLNMLAAANVELWSTL